MGTLARAVTMEKSRKEQIKVSLDCVSLGPHVPGTAMHNTFLLNEEGKEKRQAW